MEGLLQKLWKELCKITLKGFGVGVATSGIVIKELAVVVIMLGILLWAFRCTKVFRYGAVSYLLGLLLEILGSLMI